MTAPTIHTDRLILRALSRRDAAPMTPLAGDLGVARMTTAIPHPFSEEVALGFIDRMVAADTAREIAFAVQLRRGDFAGVLGFHPSPDAATELGYWLGRPFWGAGLMTEAVIAAMGWATGAWGRRAVASGHFDDNEASGRVLIKAGFLYTGEVATRFSVARAAPARTRMMVWLG